ncbi:MAG TPA: hypothetical protein VK479_13465, partial [Micropepsaceae bacterium]|nr:hypothetical protein [Micropepsaceae bacterium]
GDFAPDLTILLDIDPGAGLARAGHRGQGENRFERFDGGFHAKLRDGFLKIAADEPARCAAIDGSRNADAIAADVWRVVGERLHP